MHWRRCQIVTGRLPNGSIIDTATADSISDRSLVMNRSERSAMKDHFGRFRGVWDTSAADYFPALLHARLNQSTATSFHGNLMLMSFWSIPCPEARSCILMQTLHSTSTYFFRPPEPPSRHYASLAISATQSAREASGTPSLGHLGSIRRLRTRAPVLLDG